ncbi:MAG: FAD-binding oxidoreductase [bacterium]
MKETLIESWGRYPQQKCFYHPLFWRSDSLPNVSQKMLPYGLGRSYGDSCLNEGGVLLGARGLNRFIAFDEQTGLLRCEAGVSLDEILKFAVPRGWFLPTTPGTKFVTLGGAIANDVHGKNHHRAGTLGCHTPRFELLRSDGRRLTCSATENKEWFQATIGGLGLTGLVTWAEIQLRRIQSSFIEMESIKFGNVGEFFELSEAADKKFEHTVAWIDCLSHGRSLGRGVFMGGNHEEQSNKLKPHPDVMFDAPMDAPNFALNPLTVRAFNFAYYHKQLSKRKKSRVHYEPFFYPLDAVGKWNRIYGRRGFFQYQSVVPLEKGREATAEMLRRIARSGQASFLAVLKMFGSMSSPGALSFPRQGITLALDFPNNGNKTFRFFDELDEIVRQAGGVLYPAKDARMSAGDFQKFYPQWKEFTKFIDPRFSSGFWRRVT